MQKLNLGIISTRSKDCKIALSCALYKLHCHSLLQLVNFYLYIESKISLCPKVLLQIVRKSLHKVIFNFEMLKVWGDKLMYMISLGVNPSSHPLLNF